MGLRLLLQHLYLILSPASLSLSLDCGAAVIHVAVYHCYNHDSIVIVAK